MAAIRLTRARGLWVIRRLRVSRSFSRLSPSQPERERERDPRSSVKASPIEETLICESFARTGYGAQLLGSFDDGRGRVDERIVGHTLTPYDVEDPSIRGEVARAMAHFHAMRLPCDKSRTNRVLQEVRSTFSGESYAMIREAVATTGQEMEALLKHDFVGDMDRLVQKLEEMGGKRCWCLIDTQFLNSMIRDQPTAEGKRVVLLDFEVSLYWFRGVDVGGHFLEKEIIWNDFTDKMSGSRYPEADKRSFVREYLKEEHRLQALEEDCQGGGGEWEPSEAAVEQLLLEAEVGRLLKQVYLIGVILPLAPGLAFKDPSYFPLLKRMHEHLLEDSSRLL